MLNIISNWHFFMRFNCIISNNKLSIFIMPCKEKEQLMKCETSAHHLWQRKTQDPEKQKRRSQTQSCVSIYMSMRSSSGLNLTCTWVIGKAPALSSGSACKMDRKVSVPSNPSPARNACITGMTDSSRSSPWTRPSRYVSRKHLHWGNTKPFKKHLRKSLLLFSKDTHIKVTVNAFIRLQFVCFLRCSFTFCIPQRIPRNNKSAYYDFWRVIWHWRLEKWCWKYSFASQHQKILLNVFK